MEIGPRTQAFIDKCNELKSIEAESKGAYERSCETSQANATLVIALEAQMMTEPPSEELLKAWRDARTRMDVLDAARREVHIRSRAVRADLLRAYENCFITFRMEHIDVGDPANQEWPTL